jgi:hypothetical protein
VQGRTGLARRSGPAGRRGRGRRLTDLLSSCRGSGDVRRKEQRDGEDAGASGDERTSHGAPAESSHDSGQDGPARADFGGVERGDERASGSRVIFAASALMQMLFDVFVR